jgi:hypothetical protein
MFVPERERSCRAGGYTGWLGIVKQNSVVTEGTFSGNPFFKIKLWHFIWASLITVAAADAPFLVNYHISAGQLGDSPDRANAGAGRLNSVLASPVFIGLLLTVFGIGTQVNHNPIVGG